MTTTPTKRPAIGRTTKKAGITKKSSRTILTPDQVVAKWFYYQPSSAKYKVCYEYDDSAKKSKVSKRAEIKQAACVEMFLCSARAILQFALDPSMMRRYQNNIRIGCLTPSYFMEYFGSYEHEYKTKIQYIKYNNNNIMVECPTFVFNGFENLPGLNASKEYAFMTSRSTMMVPVFHEFLPVYWLTEKSYIHKMYFNKLAFSINPVTQIVSVDFEFTKEMFDEQTGETIFI